MKMTLLVLALMIGGMNTAFADDRPSLHGPHNVGGTLGFAPGGMTFSAFYEYLIDGSWGPNGYIRKFPKEKGPKNAAPGILAIGAGAGHHFYKKNWDLSFTPGLAILNIDAVVGDDVTTLGPSLGIGLVYQLTSIWAVGFENTRYWVWFNSDYAGELRDDMSVKVRASF